MTDPSVPHAGTREDQVQQIADEIYGIVVGTGYYSTAIGMDAAQEVARAVLGLIEADYVTRAEFDTLAEAVGKERARADHLIVGIHMLAQRAEIFPHLTGQDVAAELRALTRQED